MKAVQPVQLVLISYADERGMDVTQLALVGDNNVHLLESRSLGLNNGQTPQGRASKWLADGVFKKMGINK